MTGERLPFNGPQAINLALGVAVFSVLAEHFVEVAKVYQRQGAIVPVVAGTLVAVFVMIWSIKIFLDDHKSFSNLRTGWHGAITILFSVLVFSLLILAASALPNVALAETVLRGQFGVMLLWVLISIARRRRAIRRLRTQRADKASIDAAEAEYALRVWWFFVNLGTLLVLLSRIRPPGEADPLGSYTLLYLFFLADAHVSKTFESP